MSYSIIIIVGDQNNIKNCKTNLKPYKKSFVKIMFYTLNVLCLIHK